MLRFLGCMQISADSIYMVNQKYYGQRARLGPPALSSSLLFKGRQACKTIYADKSVN